MAHLAMPDRAGTADPARCINRTFGAALPTLPRYSDFLAVNDEARALGHLVVKLHRDQIGFVGMPIDAGRASDPGLLVDCVDQRSANSIAARGLGGEKVLK